jgi:hypothetical protein
MTPYFSNKIILSPPPYRGNIFHSPPPPNSEFNDSQVRNLFSCHPTCLLAAVNNIVNIENDSQGGQE